ncbi:ABC transporter substrate-binding protein [Providencia hangzhouensis]|uniref:ABC transporter substrate-binding protein n=1 Tax=Providencia TaxID=586 RepID=UPI000D8C3C5E|nr:MULTISPECIES: ABC transporter substrate-binding protein [Providencia]MBJ9970122.1 ABC transporter substrate-binding protein [Providencia rettgeri]MCF8962475.1 Heme-binding protein A [Providencia rettgeri]MCK9788529.1 ABC transporter substrate-binding protein [Providencia rettgeri]MDX7425457.1 ABC transporter substrate-binding protein [Providencia sp. CIM-Carb-044]PYZ57950.1 ABC transporter substrate-binding protein [Providencia rettgeri]
MKMRLCRWIASFWLLCFISLPTLAVNHPDVLLLGQVAEPQSLDPQVATAANDSRILVNLYEGLVRNADGTLTLEPALAQSWSVSDDGLTYTFHLRENIKFHDGSPFNADAVKFTFERMLDNQHPYYHTGPFPLSFFFSAIDKIETPDDKTVVFALKEPFAPFLSNLATPAGLIVSPTAVKKYDKDFSRHPSGTGPFKFDEWTANQRVVVSANEDYWDGKPSLKHVVFRPITDANTRVAEMLSGGIDAMVEVPADNVPLFVNDNRFHVYEAVGPHVWYAMLNASQPPFDDVRVRQAVNYAVNKDNIVKYILQDSAGVAQGPIPSAFDWAFDAETKAYPYDPEKARQLIAEAGAQGQKVIFYVTEGGSGMLDPIPMATAIQADLKAVGLSVEIQTFEWNTYLSKVNAGLKQAHMAEMAWMTNDPDTLPFLTLHSASWPDKGGFNSGYYSNKQLDRLLDKARVTNNLEERAQLYRQVQKIVHQDAPWLFVANWKQNAVANEHVKHFKLQPNFNLLLKDVRKD